MLNANRTISETLIDKFQLKDFHINIIYKPGNSVRFELSVDVGIKQAKARFDEVFSFLLNTYGGNLLVKLTTEVGENLDSLIQTNLTDRLIRLEKDTETTVYETEYEDGTSERDEHSVDVYWMILEGITPKDLQFLTDVQIAYDTDIDAREFEAGDLFIGCIGEKPWLINLYDDRGCDIISGSKNLLKEVAKEFADYKIAPKI